MPRLQHVLSAACLNLDESETRKARDANGGNGDAYIVHLSPMTDSLTSEEFVAARAPPDALASVEAAFQELGPVGEDPSPPPVEEEEEDPCQNEDRLRRCNCMWSSG